MNIFRKVRIFFPYFPPISTDNCLKLSHRKKMSIHWKYTLKLSGKCRQICCERFSTNNYFLQRKCQFHRHTHTSENSWLKLYESIHYTYKIFKYLEKNWFESLFLHNRLIFPGSVNAEKCIIFLYEHCEHSFIWSAQFPFK